MGPHGNHSHLSPIDNDGPAIGTDQVKRARDFIRRHPEVSLTWPRQNGTAEFIASWFAGTGTDGTVEKISNRTLMFLMDELENRFDS